MHSSIANGFFKLSPFPRISNPKYCKAIVFFRAAESAKNPCRNILRAVSVTWERYETRLFGPRSADTNPVETTLRAV